jgi:hypothetical protein
MDSITYVDNLQNKHRELTRLSDFIIGFPRSSIYAALSFIIFFHFRIQRVLKKMHFYFEWNGMGSNLVMAYTNKGNEMVCSERF